MTADRARSSGVSSIPSMKATARPLSEGVIFRVARGAIWPRGELLRGGDLRDGRLIGPETGRSIVLKIVPEIALYRGPIAVQSGVDSHR